MTPPRSRLAIIAGFLLLVVAFAAWLGYEAVQAKSNLEEARQNIQKSKDALLEGDDEEAADWADKAQSNAEAAQAHTDSVPWNIASAVPWLGGPLKTGQQIADVVLVAVADVLQPSVQIGQVMSPDRLLKDGRVDVELLRETEPKLSEISSAATKLVFQAESISDPHYLSTLRDARQQLQAQTSDLAGVIENTALAARIAPSMMGADGPRAYFMGFQTNAEARGTGGLMGAFGILRFDNGDAEVETLGRNSALDKQFTPIDFDQDFDEQWGFTNPSTDFRNSNMSSHFPYAAEIWRSMWRQQSGTTVDGAIAIDPVALSYILGAIGPVTMRDGETVTADNVVELTESTAYIRFANDNDARKQWLQDMASEVVKKVTGEVKAPRTLLDALGKGVSEGRIALWSSTPAEQKVVEETPLAHVVPDDPAPYAAVVVNNIGGNKLDYYLTRQIEYSAGACDGETRKSTVTVRLTNNAPPTGLPDYMAKLSELPFNAPLGTNAAWVSLIATKNAQITNATIDGDLLTVASGEERGHPVFNSQVVMEPGRTIVLRFELTEPTSPGAARVPIQPLVDNPVPVVSVPECAAKEQ
ncbi:DUF4012 domain-containing protein [Mycolicibacterium stellerae]|uniref:DUF4012 domain-containing protein n=1 Tax=Mycolicibacterium stellerae TaxID=2358193 RepID=UPI000F0BA0E1|nr:DUF4012 domain-containing protein [Mycolicibacterium stellerae]